MKGCSSPKKNIADVEKEFITHTSSTNARSFKLCCCCYKNKFKHSEKDKDKIILEDINTSEKMLVLDLDETLVHCSFYPLDYFDERTSIMIEGVPYDIYIQKRPGVDEFLKFAMKNFIVVIFTASLPQYANPIIDILCPNLPQSQRLFRDKCTFCDGLYVKDLKVFQFPLEKIIIIDNNPCSFMLQPDNAILSITWEGDKNDNELMDTIYEVLRNCLNANDVRNVLRKGKLCRY